MPKTYNNWKMMDKIDVAVRTGDENYRGFTGYVVDHGDKDALEAAKNWARTQTWDPELRKHTKTHEPDIHTFDNEGFTVTILNSAGGSSQGGRLSFWQCKVEKDGVEFIIGVNDSVLADLIRSSEIKRGVVKEKVMFARKSGQPGFIHEGMQSYKEAMADTERKKTMKKAKKTTKWERGGVYQSLTLTSVCLGEIFDTMKEYEVEDRPSYGWSSYKRTELRKRDEPVKTLAWMNVYSFEDLPETFEDLLQKEIDSGHIYFQTGKPPSRAKTKQLKIKKSNMQLLDQLLKIKEEWRGHNGKTLKGRYVREI